MFCSSCGSEISDKAVVCVHCGKDVTPKSHAETNANSKSKMVAGLLAIFVGPLGIHNFYLGYTTNGIIQLLLSTVGAFLVVGPFVAWIWAIVEAVQIFTGKIDKDAQGNLLKD
ncbi:MAG TPA: TM2 domain-containing protein [Bacilli bacterium]|nr:TM2 domain-containing protein [Bacilli bacterium]